MPTLRSDEYDVFWNGTRDGRDGDLLDTRLRVPNKITPDNGTRETNLRALVRGVLFAAPDGLELRDIAHRLETSTIKISSALFSMRERGEVLATDTGKRHAYQTAVLLYTLTAAARKAIENSDPRNRPGATNGEGAATGVAGSDPRRRTGNVGRSSGIEKRQKSAQI